MPYIRQDLYSLVYDTKFVEKWLQDKQFMHWWDQEYTYALISDRFERNIAMIARQILTILLLTVLDTPVCLTKAIEFCTCIIFTKLCK
jgi:hypothetical protein